MPPRLRFGLIAPAFSSPSSTVATFLVPFLHLSRNASILSSLSDNPGSYSKKIRRGRGPSSGKGKTSGRGHKGQKQHGKVPAGFQGGQTPDEVVRGKEGFENVFSEEMTPLNLDTLQSWISQGRLNPEKPITIHELCKSGAVNTVKDGVKLLARGATALTIPIHIVISRASEQAIEAVEALGGTVTTRFYTQGAIRRIRQGLMDPYISLRWEPEQVGIPALIPVKPHAPEDRVKGMGYQYRLPDPTSRKEIQYYRNWKNRGYLAHTVKEGEAVDLFWKPDLRSSDQFEAARRRKAEKSQVADNRLW